MHIQSALVFIWDIHFSGFSKLTDVDASLGFCWWWVFNELLGPCVLAHWAQYAELHNTVVIFVFVFNNFSVWSGDFCTWYAVWCVSFPLRISLHRVLVSNCMGWEYLGRKMKSVLGENVICSRWSYFNAQVLEILASCYVAVKHSVSFKWMLFFLAWVS